MKESQLGQCLCGLSDQSRSNHAFGSRPNAWAREVKLVVIQVAAPRAFFGRPFEIKKCCHKNVIVLSDSGAASPEYVGFACFSSADLVRTCQSLLRHRVRSSAPAELVESRFETSGQLFCGPSAPVVQEDHHGPSFDHVVMDCDYVYAVLPKGL